MAGRSTRYLSVLGPLGGSAWFAMRVWFDEANGFMDVSHPVGAAGTIWSHWVVVTPTQCAVNWPHSELVSVVITIAENRG